MENFLTMTSRQVKKRELHPVITPLDAPFASRKTHLLRQGPPKLRKKEPDTKLTFDSCKQTTTLRRPDTTALTALRLDGSFNPLTFQQKYKASQKEDTRPQRAKQNPKKVPTHNTHDTLASPTHDYSGTPRTSSPLPRPERSRTIAPWLWSSIHLSLCPRDDWPSSS